MELTRYEHTAAPQLAQLPCGDDLYTFSVLRSIVQGPCGKIITDHARLIVLYTCPPYPGWCWMPPDATAEEMARAWAVVQQELPAAAGYRVNVRDAFADYILRTPEGAGLRIDMQLDAYGCDAVREPARPAAGNCYAVDAALLETAVDWAMASSAETGLDPLPRAARTAEMQDFLARRRLFMWKDAQGTPVTMCTVNQSGALGYVGHVYTPPEQRRRGYAEGLVHHVTRAMLRQGMRPALCVMRTNAAAAACYRKLGYTLRGRFCTIGP